MNDGWYYEGQCGCQYFLASDGTIEKGRMVSSSNCGEHAPYRPGGFYNRCCFVREAQKAYREWCRTEGVAK